MFLGLRTNCHIFLASIYFTEHTMISLKPFTLSPKIVIVIIWLGLTGFNINKAFHIDDTFHLEAAMHIAENPTKPMSGLINWGQVPTPMYMHNQPPLFFALIGLVGSIFGFTEIPMHLLISIFSLLALIYFYRLLQLFEVKKPNVFLILFGCTPAFVVNQNLMTDIPILVIVLAAAYYMVLANRTQKLKYHLLTAICISIGVMIKYSLLPVFAVYIVVLLITRKRKNLFVLLIPIGVLASWAIWNHLEAGRAHLTTRPAGIHVEDIFAFPASIGAIAFFASLAFKTRNHTPLQFLAWYFPVVLLFLYLLFISASVPEQMVAIGFSVLFTINGVLLYILLIRKFSEHNRLMTMFANPPNDRLILFFLIGALSLFIALFAPFNATRHVMLILPFILICLSDLIERASKKLTVVTLSLTVFLGLGIGVADWVYANSYRRVAAAIDIDTKNNVWSCGHWGWQWYADKNGMQQFHGTPENVKIGDYFVIPTNVHGQEVPENIVVDTVDTIVNYPECSIGFAVHGPASMYKSHIDIPSWSFSREPIDVITVYRVSDIIAL